MPLKLQGAAPAQCRRLSMLLCCPSFVINTEVGRGVGAGGRGMSFVTVSPILALTGFSWLTEVCSR